MMARPRSVVAVACSILAALAAAGCSSSSTPSTPTAAVPVITSFTTSAADIGSGETPKLTWAVTGSTLVQIDNGVGAVAASGTLNVAPNATTTYTLTATNATGSVTATAKVTVHTIMLQGSFTIRGTYSGDFDTGREVLDATADVFWEMVDATNGVRYLVPGPSTKFAVLGTVALDSITYSSIASRTLSTTQIDGSSGASGVMPVGTVIVGMTNAGRLVKFRVDVLAYNLTVTYVVWNS
jgi:hypothetical protein